MILNLVKSSPNTLGLLTLARQNILQFKIVTRSLVRLIGPIIFSLDLLLVVTKVIKPMCTDLPIFQFLIGVYYA